LLYNRNMYDKMEDFIHSVFNVFKLINKKAEKQQNKRLKMIGLTIYNYVLNLSKIHNVNLDEIVEPDQINLIPIFEYISVNNIELYDLQTIRENDLDINNNSHIERFVLSHIYEITQK